MQNPLYEHTNVTSCLMFQSSTVPAPSYCPRFLINLSGKRVFFNTNDLNIMSSPKALLNDTCLNGITEYMCSILSHPLNPASLSSSRCALFSTFHILLECYHATNIDVWRRVRHTEYWLKDVWILPLHRSYPAGHWVLCTIFPHKQKLFLFDSFANKYPWKRESKEVLGFIKRLVSAANANDKPLQMVMDEGWTAQPVLVQPRQSNGYDCGLFVLANIIAVLHGFHVSGAVEGDMIEFRRLLFLRLLALPPLASLT